MKVLILMWRIKLQLLSGVSKPCFLLPGVSLPFGSHRSRQGRVQVYDEQEQVSFDEETKCGYCCSGGTRVVEAGVVEPRVTMTKMRADVRFVLVVLYYCYPQISKNSEDKKNNFEKKKSQIKKTTLFLQIKQLFCVRQRSPVSILNCQGRYSVS